MAFQVDVESSAMRSSAITSSGEIFWVWFLDHESAMTWRNEHIYIYIIWIHGIEWCTHITTLVSARTGLSPAPMFQYTKTLWTFAWKSPFGILASMGSWLLAMLVRWFMRWCVPHETESRETESQSQRFPTCRDKMKFGCYLKKGSSLPLKKVRPTSASAHVAGVVQSPSEMPVPTYVPSPTSPREVGSREGGGCEPRSSPPPCRVGCFRRMRTLEPRHPRRWPHNWRPRPRNPPCWNTLRSDCYRDNDRSDKLNMYNIQMHIWNICVFKFSYFVGWFSCFYHHFLVFEPKSKRLKYLRCSLPGRSSFPKVGHFYRATVTRRRPKVLCCELRVRRFFESSSSSPSS